MQFKYLAVETVDGVVVCTINNPPQNLMNAEMVAELGRLADQVEADAGARVLVLTGGVPGIFITHYDVGELVVMSEALRQAPGGPPGELHAAHQVFNKLQFLSKPVIAALNGVTMGGGCELALVCDFRFMARVGVIGQPEILVGILPGAGGTQRLTRLLGPAKALDLALTGRVIGADEAEAVGLVHKALDADQLMPYTLDFARRLAGQPPLSVAMIKRCVHEGGQLPLLEGLRLEQGCFWQTMLSDDAGRLMKDYLEGRMGPLTG
jgi:enoyl-CoA hydratase